jgi:hypothetical protein
MNTAGLNLRKEMHNWLRTGMKLAQLRATRAQCSGETVQQHGFMIFLASDGGAWSASSSSQLYSHGTPYWACYEGTAYAFIALYHPGLRNLYLLQQWLYLNLGVMVLHWKKKCDTRPDGPRHALPPTNGRRTTNRGYERNPNDYSGIWTCHSQSVSLQTVLMDSKIIKRENQITGN